MPSTLSFSFHPGEDKLRSARVLPMKKFWPWHLFNDSSLCWVLHQCAYQLFGFSAALIQIPSTSSYIWYAHDLSRVLNLSKIFFQSLNPLDTMWLGFLSRVNNLQLNKRFYLKFLNKLANVCSRSYVACMRKMSPLRARL